MQQQKRWQKAKFAGGSLQHFPLSKLLRFVAAHRWRMMQKLERPKPRCRCIQPWRRGHPHSECCTISLKKGKMRIRWPFLSLVTTCLTDIDGCCWSEQDRHLHCFQSNRRRQCLGERFGGKPFLVKPLRLYSHRNLCRRSWLRPLFLGRIPGQRESTPTSQPGKPVKIF